MFTDLNHMYRCMHVCHECSLSETRQAVVTGCGNPHAKLMLIGEAPGEAEDRTGIPFVGSAGELLTKMLHAMNLTRQHVYICNVVGCRPPNNREPSQSEAQCCCKYVQYQIEMISPSILCLLGKVAMKYLLHMSESISKVRGQWFTYSLQNIPTMITYHPAYLLRTPAAKIDVWHDLQQVMKLYDTI